MAEAAERVKAADQVAGTVVVEETNTNKGVGSVDGACEGAIVAEETLAAASTPCSMFSCTV